MTTPTNTPTPAAKSRTLTTEYPQDGICRILSLDGGGAKGFYTLGILKEIEGMLNCPLYKRFDLIYGTSTGAILATLLALGYEVEAIHALYKEHVPRIMRGKNKEQKTQALEELTKQVYGDVKFDSVKTGVGVVSTKWVLEKPMIFKASVAQAHGRKGTFVPGFGVSIADAVQASCSAFPFFERKTVTTASGDAIELVDGGYCANNPTLYAIADAVSAMGKTVDNIRLVSLGVGIYPQPEPSWIMKLAQKYSLSLQLLQKTLEINTQSMEQLRAVLYKDLPTVRISDTFERPEMATDLMEHNLAKLNLLRQRGGESFAAHETKLREFLL